MVRTCLETASAMRVRSLLFNSSVRSMSAMNSGVEFVRPVIASNRICAPRIEDRS